MNKKIDTSTINEIYANIEHVKNGIVYAEIDSAQNHQEILEAI